MADSLRIVQLTDIHIGATDEPVTGIDVRQKFLRVISHIKSLSFDLLVISGDLAAIDGEIESYQWIQQTLADLPYPYLVMTGNHDQVKTMEKVFDLENCVQQGMLFFTQTVKNKYLIFLDTSSYILPELQLQWLKQQLDTHPQPCLLFIHHPPVLCGCNFMDNNYPLRNHEEVWALIRQYPAVLAIFCGHYHNEVELIRDGKPIYVTPSTSLQIDKISASFTIESQRPGWRSIEWNDQGVHTYVDYIDE